MADQRLFISVEPPDEIKQAMYRELEPFRMAWSFIKWEIPEKLHVTVKFLGDVPEMKLGVIQSAAEGVAKRTAPFFVVLGGLGVFPNNRRPRVIWIGIRSGMKDFGKLHSAIEESFDDIGFPREKRRFSAHITVGRIRHPRFLDLPQESMCDHRFHSRKISLIRSRLTPKGSIYTTVAEYPFYLQGGRSSE